MRDIDVSVLKGKVLKNITNNDDELLFETKDGRTFKMYHSQSCCESVYLEDVCGDLKDLIGSKIIQAECETNSDKPKEDDRYTPDSFTWTFYKLATIKGTVTLRWYGSSNGYYSESVDFVEVT